MTPVLVSFVSELEITNSGKTCFIADRGVLKSRIGYGSALCLPRAAGPSPGLKPHSRNLAMPRTLFSAALVAVATLAVSSSFAAGEADTYRDQLNAPSVAQRSGADVDPMSQALPAVKSAVSRQDVRAAAAAANRAGLLPHGEASF